MAELNGEPAQIEDLRALAMTNYGHFTSMLVEGGRVRGLELHLERLVSDCRTVFGTGLDVERVKDFARRAVPDDGPVVVRVTVFDPGLGLGNAGAPAHPQVLVTTRAAAGTAFAPLRVRCAAYVRDLPAVKSVGLFGAIRHRREAQLAGFDDALFVDGRDGREAVSEGGTWNVGFVQDGQVVWPDAECLPGTTMRLLQQVHPAVRGAVRKADLGSFEAAFATNAALGVRAIARIDDTEFPGHHQVIEELRRAYARIQGDEL